MTTPFTPATYVYVVKLQGPDPGDPQRVAGRIEHVMSGRRHDFDNAQALIGLLLHEQLQAQQERKACAPGSRPYIPYPRTTL